MAASVNGRQVLIGLEETTATWKTAVAPGAGDTYAVDDTGGTQTHNHDFTADGHNHFLEIPSGSNVSAGSGHQETFNTQIPTGTTESANNDPPYFSLAYIMYVG